MAVILTAAIVHFAQWPVATIGSKFGGIPTGLPGWHFPSVSLEAMRVLMGPAFTIAALGAIESLLSAMVADGKADTRQDPNQEQIGHGKANNF
jgi:SulP family sulfate permease